MGDVIPFRRVKRPSKESLESNVEVIWCPELEMHLEFRTFDPTEVIITPFGQFTRAMNPFGNLVAVRV